MRYTMRTLRHIFSFILTMILLTTNVFGSVDVSTDTGNGQESAENAERTEGLITHIEAYLRENDTYVGIIARRGAGDSETGVSDTDGLDLSGMAHCGFVIRNGFGKDAEYITFNLVRVKDAEKTGGKTYDLSELRVWSLPHFFIGAFEKDAIVFLPEKRVQLKLWNLLRANGQLDVTPRKRFLKESNGEVKKDEKGEPRYLIDNIITNGAFAVLYTPEYNLLSDYLEESTLNCNEHLLKTYIAFRDHWQPWENGYDILDIGSDARQHLYQKTQHSIKTRFTPRQMVLSRTKSTFAFTQNIRFGERYQAAPTFFGFKLKKEKFDVVSVDSFCDVDNQELLAWADFKVFRESRSEHQGWIIQDWGKEYVKVNRFTGQKNTISEI